MISRLRKFAETLVEEVVSFPQTAGSDWADDDIFTAIILDYLAEAGITDDTVMCPYREQGAQLSAYSISSDFEEIKIYVSFFNSEDTLKPLDNRDIDAALMRGLSVYRLAIHDFYKSFKSDSDTYGFAYALSQNKERIKKVNIVLLTNYKTESVPRDDIELENATVTFSVLDMETLFDNIHNEENNNTVVVDFMDLTGSAIPCIENHNSPAYSAYLAIIDGFTIYQLYDKFGPRLLERNVRSFLQVRGTVNKGINDTLRVEPEMFLAYNNGISVTAESVDILRDENGKPSIKRIVDMQIVNGGQTTASIYSAYKDKKANIDLTKVFVQMKLSVINDHHNLQSIVPKISKYANTQNRIQIADFSANDPFHKGIEKLSKQISSPEVSGQAHRNWFYERSRGQYNDVIANLPSPAERRLFRSSHIKFTKTDLAKFENSWDQLPHLVSTGAQKNFRYFTLRLQERKNFIPDTLYYKRLIAKGVLFKNIEEIVTLQNYGGYRANIVTYTLALLSYHSAQRIDLMSIWNKQKLSPALEREISRASQLVHSFITNPPDGANISEWCKKEKCWIELKAKSFLLSDELRQELVDTGKPDYSYASGARTQGIEEVSHKEADLIDRVALISASTWFSLARWAKETGNFEGWQRGIVYSVGIRISRNRKPTYKQSIYAWEAYRRALDLGFKGEEH